MVHPYVTRCYETGKLFIGTEYDAAQSPLHIALSLDARQIAL